MLKRILLVLSLLSVVLLAQAAPTVQAQSLTSQIQGGLCQGANGNLELDSTPTVSSCNNGPNGVDKVNQILRRFVNLLSGLVGVVAVIMIIIGGFRYVTSGGNDTSVTGAKNTILYAIIGLVVVALAQIIVHFVLNKIVNS
jgi:hypothetical protein